MSEAVVRKCSEKLRKNHRKTLVLESLFNMRLQRLQREYFPVNSAKFLRTPICRTSWNGCFWNVYIISVLKIIRSNLRGDSSIQFTFFCYYGSKLPHNSPPFLNPTNYRSVPHKIKSCCDRCFPQQIRIQATVRLGI